MGITIKFTYNGREYNDFADAMMAALSKSIEGYINDKIAPFADEITASGGTVSADFKEDGNFTLDIDNISVDLRQRILDAFQ